MVVWLTFSISSFVRIPIEFGHFDICDMLNIAAVSENKKMLPATYELIAATQKKDYRSGKSSIQVIKDKTLPMEITFSMEPFHPFFEEFHDKIQRLIESGTMRFNEAGQSFGFDEEVPPLVLSMDDLGIGFVVCMIPLTLGAIAFIVEVLSPNVKIFARKICEGFIAAIVVSAFLDSSVIGI